MFDRLVGLETEYGVRFRPRTPGGRRVANGTLFDRLIAHVGSKVPVVSAIIKEFGWFTANGGAVRFERSPFVPFLSSAGVVEGSTPECRGPRQLLLYQRAQDLLLARAAANSGGDDGEVALLKHNRDAGGRCYGSHENYEATIASGPTLLAWRLVMGVLLPVLVLPLLLIAFTVVFLFLPLLIVCGSLQEGRRPPVLFETGLNWLLGLLLLPAALVLEAFVRLTAFRRQRRALLAFLVSRPVVAGAGTVGPDGRFGLSPRAAAVRSVCGTAAECYRPVFYYGHLFKAVLSLLGGDRWSYARLFWRRQRMQIAVGDSNMAHQAEYLKIGTTLLVLEAIEAGELGGAPRPRRPLRALRAVCADPDLRATVPLDAGRRWTAVQIQRFYHDACRRFVRRSGAARPEAEAVLRLWEQTLDALQRDPRQLVGRLDWVTKRYLLDAQGPDAPVEVRRKIDLRYHELSREGYYFRLEAAGVAPTLVEPEEVLAAIGAPPEGTPAAARGRLIREHAAAPQQLAASWHAVVITEGTKARVVRLPERGPA